MRRLKFSALLMMAIAIALQSARAGDFEGRISATLTRNGLTEHLVYAAGTNCLRVESADTDRPHAWDLIDRQTGALILCFPNNRSFVRLPVQNLNSTPDGMTPMPNPAMSPGMNPAMPPGFGPANLPGAPAAPAMPQMPAMPGMPPGVGPQAGAGIAAMPAMPMPMERLELKDTGDKTNLLGLACEHFQLQSGPELMDIWATDELLAYQPHLENQPHRFGSHMIEDQWGEMLKAKKMFPLLAVLRFAPPGAPGGAPPAAGPERLRFEVQSIKTETITDDTLFQPPADYQELRPLPF